MSISKRNRLSRAPVLIAFLILIGGTAHGQQQAPPQLSWTAGPGTTPIGEALAEIDLPENYVSLDAEGTRQLMELMENPVTGTERATVAPASEAEDWFLVFEYEEVGYVPDDEQHELDATAMLASIREGTEAANEERRERGWATMAIVGWHEAPRYDPQTSNLTWAIIGESQGHRVVNRIAKVLGRRGVMTVTLVASPEELATAIPKADALLSGFRYQPGNTYAEYVPGQDKLAQYGLTALVVGGAGAALVKSGLLAKLWKPVAFGLAALGVTIKRWFFSGRTVEQNLEGPIG